MSRYARIENGCVAEIILLPDGVSVASAFHPDLAKAIKPCAPSVVEGWGWDGSAFAPPASPPPPSAADLASYAASKRFAIETGGTVLGGKFLRTDREARSAVTEVEAALSSDPTFSTDWKLSDGSWVTINAATLPPMLNAIASHRAACFGCERAVGEAIAGGSITTTAEIDAYAWPSNS